MTIFLNKFPEQWSTVLGVDLETTSLDPHSGHILSIALSDGQDVWIFLHWYGLEKLRDVLEDESIVKIFHNAAFDLSFIKGHLDIETQNIYDSMLCEQVLIAARDMQASLADALARRLGVMVYKDVRESFYNHPGFHIKPPTEEQINYMAQDVIYLPKHREAQIAEGEKEKCLWTFQIENDAVSAFAEMKYGGAKLDSDRWYEYLEVFKQKIEESELKLQTIVGQDFVLKFMNKSKTPVEKSYMADQINFGSSTQLKHLFLNRFNVEVETTDQKYLEEFADNLADDHPAREFIEELLNNKHWRKLPTWQYPQYVHAETGFVYPSPHQIGTSTGRSSYSNPNLQQTPKPVPEEPNMRQLWIADAEDMSILCADYAQNEIRILAQVSKDEAMLAACNKKDVYIEFGSAMYGKEIKKSDPERQIAKVFVLATGYRSGLGRLRRASKLPLKQCETIRNLIYDKFPTMRKYGRAAEAFAKRNGYVMTLSGRRRYFKPSDRLYTEAVATIVQGTGACMLKIALAAIYKDLVQLKKENKIDKRTRVWIVMHDELSVLYRVDEKDIIQEIVTRRMEEAGKKLCPDVLHIAEAHSGYRWDKN